MASQFRPGTKSALSLADIDQRRLHYAGDNTNRMRHLALAKGDVTEALLSFDCIKKTPHIFNTTIPIEGAPITAQKSSGRCWIFAATNVLRLPIMKNYNLDRFELSQQYLFYFDKLEKANYFLEHIIDTADREIDDRLVQRLLLAPMSDGGQWDMLYNLVKKYGIVPQVLYPDTWNAENSRHMRVILQTKLREYAVTLRALTRSGDAEAVSLKKDEQMEHIQHILTTLLGVPPELDEEFVWEYTNKEKQVFELRSTPIDFAKAVTEADSEYDMNSMVSLVHDPRSKLYTLLTVERLGNIIGGRNVTYINVEMTVLRTACVDMIKAGLPVFFGCDFGKFRHRNKGILDLSVFDYQIGLGTTLLAQSKADRLRSGESKMTHAMILTGVHLDLDTGKPIRWRVQNSHGPESGDKGYLVMTDDWMSEFMYQAVVNKKFLCGNVRDILLEEPVVLPLWDPMGALA
ncbi:hypothetical protein NLG97_g1914 [Lecanicillium saksenae]|uniref:Uncharacterized protein n=1 Tax=Lecanicillium saksenae TaxID=468837 RepID=A0ACC1R6G8_9HYPO|nr:hypothetical protein NLG97_g1914 [Lecanicillium saksenae]